MGSSLEWFNTAFVDGLASCALVQGGGGGGEDDTPICFMLQKPELSASCLGCLVSCVQLYHFTLVLVSFIY